jgi:hypothetical protein
LLPLWNWLGFSIDYTLFMMADLLVAGSRSAGSMSGNRCGRRKSVVAEVGGTQSKKLSLPKKDLLYEERALRESAVG